MNDPNKTGINALIHSVNGTTNHRILTDRNNYLPFEDELISRQCCGIQI